MMPTEDGTADLTEIIHAVYKASTDKNAGKAIRCVKD